MVRLGLTGRNINRRLSDKIIRKELGSHNTHVIFWPDALEKIFTALHQASGILFSGVNPIFNTQAQYEFKLSYYFDGKIDF